MSRLAISGLLALTLCHGVAALELGRLFLTPAERETLDRLRHARPITPPPLEASAPAETLDELAGEPPVPDVPLTVDGFIARSSGASTVWINGAEATAGALAGVGIAAGRLHLERSAVRVPLTRGPSTVMLKPGQSFDPDSKQVSDAYQHAPAP